MPNSSVFIFQDDQEHGNYNLYLFKDFSGNEKNMQKDIFDALSDIRKRIYSPEIIFIICENIKFLDKNKIKNRFTNKQKIKYINYKNISSNILKKGISEIVKKNKVVQVAPHGTLFKKTSGAESSYFIKASLSLLEYSEICFVALATCKKITLKKLLPVKKIYVDTSSIISLIQAIVFYCNITSSGKFNPQIINFRSYKQNSIDFNSEEEFTIISASTSGNLRKEKQINKNKCLTLFYPKNPQQKEMCLFELNETGEKLTSSSPRLISLTTEDFSLEYSKSKEVIITKNKINNIDKNQTIKKILSLEFNRISYGFSFNEIKKRNQIKFNEKYIYNIINKNEFIKDTLDRALSLKNNCIIYDFKNPENSVKNIEGIKKENFISSNYKKSYIMNKTVVVFLTQTTDSELISISQKLRKFNVVHITYIIGVLITSSHQQSTNLENNICFNDTNYNYGFYCYLNLPLSDIADVNIANYNLSNGFVFYDGNNAKNLNPKQIYLVVCLILELLRGDNSLTDNISHHDVLSPKNFSRFNDPLLQISLLSASKGRELNFYSNVELSREMKDVIMDLMKQNNEVGAVFINALKKHSVKLTDEDLLAIKNEYPNLFTKEEVLL